LPKQISRSFVLKQLVLAKTKIVLKIEMNLYSQNRDESLFCQNKSLDFFCQNDLGFLMVCNALQHSTTHCNTLQHSATLYRRECLHPPLLSRPFSLFLRSESSDDPPPSVCTCVSRHTHTHTHTHIHTTENTCFTKCTARNAASSACHSGLSGLGFGVWV